MLLVLKKMHGKWQDQSKWQETPGLEPASFMHIFLHIQMLWRSLEHAHFDKLSGQSLKVSTSRWKTPSGFSKGRKLSHIKEFEKRLSSSRLSINPLEKIFHTHHCISSSDNPMSSSISTSKRCTNSSTAPRFARSASSGTTPKVSWFVPHLPKLFTKKCITTPDCKYFKSNEKYIN